MTDQIITRQAVSVQGRSGKLTVSGKLKIALDLMLFEGSSRQEAAEKAGLADHSLRTAIRKPHVKAYYNQGLEVLRTSGRARNILALERVRDKSENDMAAVAAAKALENLVVAAADEPLPGVARVPGLVFIINTPAGAVAGPDDSKIIDVTPAKKGPFPST